MFAVQTASLEFCRANKELPVSPLSPVGHIASVVTSDRPLCDGSKHPWVISGSQGQRVNLTVYDFTIDAESVYPSIHSINLIRYNTNIYVHHIIIIISSSYDIVVFKRQNRLKVGTDKPTS